MIAINSNTRKFVINYDYNQLKILLIFITDNR